MARFGTFLYGTRLYGDSGRISAGTRISTRVIDYGRVEIKIFAQEQPVTERWTYVLLRKNNGTSEEPADGAPIASGTIIDSVTTIIDTTTAADVSQPYGWTYYTLFVFDTSGQWIRDCATYITAPNPYESGRYIIDRLPRVLTSAENNPLDPPDYTSLLYQFLSGLGTTFDTMRTSIQEALPERIRRVNQATPLHHVMASGLGMTPEPGMGIASSARLFRQAGDIYRKKGTLGAVEGYVEALTGWNTTASESSNLLLDLNDASFEDGIGGWVASPGILTVRPPDEVIPLPDTDYDYELAPFARNGVGEITPLDPDYDVSLTLRPQDGRTSQIPVVAGRTYWLSTYFRGTPSGVGYTSSPTVYVNGKIIWYDEFGDVISESDPDVTVPPDSPVISTENWNIAKFSFEAPPLARFCGIRLILMGGRKYYLDRIQLSEGDKPYQDPRTVNVICAPRRVNLLTRPNEEIGTFYWTASEGSVAESTDGYVVGTYSLQFSPDGTSGNFVAVSESIPARPSTVINFSGFFSGGECGIRVVFYDADGNEIALRTPTEEDLIDTTTNVPGVSTAGDWNRVDLQSLTPDGAVSMRVEVTGSETAYGDLMILERSDRPQWYFDYVLADLAAEDALFRDTTGHRYSLLYPNRILKLARIKQELKHYLPLGVRYRVLLWDSDDPEVAAQLPYGV